jgi:hypothetical protein
MASAHDFSAEGLRAAFDGQSPLTVGLEEEVMLLDPQTMDLSPSAAEVLARLGGDPRFKPELPASQLEILTEPAPSVREPPTDSRCPLCQPCIRSRLLRAS